MASAKEVAKLRAETGAGVMESKKALQDAGDDYEKAKELIKERGLAKAAKKSDREANQGVIEAYVHAGGRIGALVELASETDFVARGQEFKDLARSIAMQVAAMEPADVDELLKQDYIKEPGKTIGELVTKLAASTGENVQVRRIARFELGKAS
ncbi:MAG TPA: translation elongation factor Ts [Candidatus Limnocylindria bacterium]|nr:translation elongation factor Ts [Candidatus Limnocylindria bacterium]